MRIRRDINSIPFRSASETWQQIVNLVVGQGSTDSRQLDDATGIMASIISDEYPANHPIIVEGVGPQLRVYCRYGMLAVEEGNEEVDPLSWNPTAGNWTMHVPCDKENIDWVKKSLKKTSPRIKVFDIEKSIDKENDVSNEMATKSPDFGVNWNFGGN